MVEPIQNEVSLPIPPVCAGQAYNQQSSQETFSRVRGMRTRSGCVNAHEHVPEKMGVSIMGALEYAIICGHSESKCCGNWKPLRKSP